MGNLILGLVPALGWGIQAIVMQKIGGRFTNKVMGMVTGGVIFALVIFLFHRPTAITSQLVIGSVLSGIFWSIGQILQVRSFDVLGVSAAMPISTGEQLIGTILFGIFYFREWTKTSQYYFGVAAVFLIIVGVIIISIRSGSAEIRSTHSNFRGLIILTVSSLGLIGYAVIPRIFKLNGWDMLLPQAISMWIVMAFIVSRVKNNQMWHIKSWQNILTGLCFAIANLTILLSNEYNGIAIGYTLSQLNVVVATLGGIFILHETNTREQKKRIIIGLLLIVTGAILIGLTK